MLTFVDTHCHLNSKEYDGDLQKVITSSKKAGVKKMVVPGFDLPTSIKSANIAHTYKNVCFGTCGIHPYHANKVYDLAQVSTDMKHIVSTYKDTIVAIGEVGLDYHLYTHEDASGKKEQQKELLKIEIELSLEKKLPLILHCRSAWEDYVELLSMYKKDGIRGVSHCFEGGLTYLQDILELGFYIGINGLATFSDRLKDIVKVTPLDRILLETDSPFLTPVPLRGTKNTPKNIRLVAKYIAELKNETLDAVSVQTTKNAYTLFQLN